MKIRAAVLHAPNTPLSIETLTLEAPRDGEILVRMVATGVCHTDVSMMGRPFPAPQPIVLGHEGAGIVEAIGRNVAKVRPGDRVVMSYASCGRCPSCLAHAPTYCHDFVAHNFVGRRADGSTALTLAGTPVRHAFFGQSSFATYSLCTERNAVRVPDTVSDALFPLLGPLGCGIQTGAGAVVNVLRPRLGESLVVFGTGAVGLAAIMAARALGAATIVAVDRVPQRLALSRELGATHAVDASEIADVPAHLRQLTRHGADTSLDTTGVPALIRQAIDCLAPRGRCGFLGAVAPGVELPVDIRDMMIGGKTLRGIVEGDADPDVFVPALIALQAQGRFPFEKLMRAYPFEQVNEAIADSAAGRTIKPVLMFPVG